MKTVFFGTPDIAVASLDALAEHGMLPSLIITAPDTRQGRGLILTPPPAKVWADAHGIPTLQPATLKDESIHQQLKDVGADMFVVVAYGKLLPQAVLDIPPQGTINVHPSLLAKHRGPCPIESQILVEKDWRGVGVSIMQLDAEMDHGPVYAQRAQLPELENAWPMRASQLRPILARHGAELLVDTLKTMPAPIEQNHAEATLCSKITKANAEINLADDAETNYRKFLAYDVWPRAYFFKDNKRIIITDASFEDGVFVIKKVIPEGKKEQTIPRHKGHDTNYE